MTDTTTDILLDELLSFRSELPASQQDRFTVLVRDALVNYAALPSEQKTRVIKCLAPKFSDLHNDKVLYFTCEYN